MKKIIFTLLCSALISYSLIAQTNLNTELSPINEKTYTIKIDDYQIVELFEFKDGEFSGSLTNSIWTADTNGLKIELIAQRVEIPTESVKKLMTELQTNGFENIPDGRSVKGCVFGSGGVTISFITKRNGIEKNALYWEPESYAYYRGTNIPEIIKVREILKIIREEIDFEGQYDEFTYKLPEGKYVYSSIILDKRRKKQLN